MNICPPAITTIALGLLISGLTVFTGSLNLVFNRLFMTFIGTAVLQLLCIMKMRSFAWALVIIFIVLMLVSLLFIIYSLNKENKSLKDKKPTSSVIVVEDPNPLYYDYVHSYPFYWRRHRGPFARHYRRMRRHPRRRRRV